MKRPWCIPIRKNADGYKRRRQKGTAEEGSNWFLFNSYRTAGVSWLCWGFGYRVGKFFLQTVHQEVERELPIEWAVQPGTRRTGKKTKQLLPGCSALWVFKLWLQLTAVAGRGG